MASEKNNKPRKLCAQTVDSLNVKCTGKGFKNTDTLLPSRKEENNPRIHGGERRKGVRQRTVSVSSSLIAISQTQNPVGMGEGKGQEDISL
jgi:hypothetical protein